MTVNKDEKVISIPELSFSTSDAGFIPSYLGPQQKYKRVERIVQHMASSFNEFKAIDQHVFDNWKKIPFLKRIIWQHGIIKEYHKRFSSIRIGPSCFPKMLVEICEHLVKDGLLLSSTQFTKELERHRIDGPKKISSIAIVSGNRPHEIKRAVLSYGHHIKEWRPGVRIVVSDDSLDEKVNNSYREELSSIAQKEDIQVDYIGPKEKKEFIDRLSMKGFSKDLISFALINREVALKGYGKNRNCLQLATSGELSFNADDDTFCRLHKSELSKTGVGFFGQKENPQHIIPQRNREESLNKYPVFEQSLFDLHEKVLAKNLATCVLDNVNEQHSDIKNLSPLILQRMLKGRGHIFISFNGLVGDSGSGDQFSHLFVNKEKAAEVLQSKNYFERYSQQRNICKSSDRILIGRKKSCMTTFYAIDSSRGIPPFFPFFRMEDATFARTCMHTLPQGYMAYLPWQLEHLPSERKRNPIHLSKFSPTHNYFTMHELITIALENLPVNDTFTSFATNCRRLGEAILDFCHIEHGDFVELVWRRELAKKTRQILNMENFLKIHRSYPRFWKKAMQGAINSLYEQIQSKTFLCNKELLKIKEASMAEKWMKEQLQMFGKLIVEWPSILEASEQLKREGLGPEKNLNSPKKVASNGRMV